MVGQPIETVLLVDDDPDVIEFLSYNLKIGGYKVFSAVNGLEGLNKTIELQPSLVLLDLMMPEMDGIETCQAIRNDNSINQPIIAFLTSRSEDYSQVAALDAGADDYITKPVRPRLLISKVGSLLRRAAEKSNDWLGHGLVIDREQFCIILNEKKIDLPKKEFEILELLASKPEKVFDRDKILSLVWGDDTIVGSRTIDVHIRKLREKIGDNCIKTVKGIGYKYVR